MSQQEENPSSVATRRRVTVAAHWKDAARQQHPEATDEEIIRAAEELRHRHNSETATRAIGVRLAREDPNAMTSAARSSSRHVKSLDRWTEAAREQQPDADDEQIASLAAELRSAYYSELGRRSGVSKRAKATGRREGRQDAAGAGEPVNRPARRRPGR